MDKTRKQIVSVAAGVILAAFGGAVTILGTPWLGWWLMVVGIGATIVALRPEWFMNRVLFGKRKEATPLRRVGIQDLTFVSAPSPGYSGPTTAISESGNVEVDLKRVGIENFDKVVDARDSAKFTATDSKFTGPSRVVDPYAGVDRNDPCPCGSGKKFKKCHGRKHG